MSGGVGVRGWVAVGRGRGEGLQLQAIAMIYSIVAAVSIFDTAAARREQRASFAFCYRQARTVVREGVEI